MTPPPPADDGAVRVLVGLPAVLRAAGVGAGADRVAAFVAAVDLLGVTDRRGVYWAGRYTLCADPDELVVYDRAFAQWFDPTTPAARRGPARARPPTPWSAVLPTGRENPEAADADTDQSPLRVAASGTEVLRGRDLGALSAAEREHLRLLLARLRPRPPVRRSRRRRPEQRGPVDARRTLRAALRHHGEVAVLRRHAPAVRPRRVVLLVDVSGSMAPYADALLRFAHVVSRTAPTAVEVFTLGTRLTRITRELRQRDPEQALRAAGRAIPDWSGGTRLGEVLAAFVDRWGRRGTARGAVVVVFSDGWERGDPRLLGEQTARLRRLAHGLVWVNPHAGKAGYAPVQGGIAAALPHVDGLLAGHSLATLEEVLAVVRRLGGGRTGRPGSTAGRAGGPRRGTAGGDRSRRHTGGSDA